MADKVQPSNNPTKSKSNGDIDGWNTSADEHDTTSTTSEPNGKLAYFDSGCLRYNDQTDDISPEDSSSQISNKSRSTSSRTSISSTKMKIQAKKAALKAEMAAFDERRKLAEEQLHLDQRRKELELKVEIAKAEAEEKVVLEAEEASSNHSFKSSSPKSDKFSGRDRQHVVTETGIKTDNSDFMRILAHDSQLQQKLLVDAIQLPKTEMMSFNGDSLKYWTFIRAFEHAVDNKSVDSSAKLLRLMQYCTEKARSVIKCCSVMEPSVGYVRAKTLLKERFGNDFVMG